MKYVLWLTCDQRNSKPQTSPDDLYLASDATVCMYGNLLDDVFISVDCLIKFADVLSMEDLFKKWYCFY